MQKIQNKLIIILVSLVILTISILGVSNYLYGKKILESEIKSSIEDSKNRLNGSIEEYLKNFESAINMYSNMDILKNVYDEPQMYYDKVQNSFKAFQDSHEGIAFTYFGPKEILLENKKVVSWPDVTSSLFEDKNWLASKRDWYIKAYENQNQIIWSKPYFDVNTNRPTITASKSVNNKNGEFIGVMAIDFYLDDISNKVNQYKNIEQSKINIVYMDNNKATIIASTNENETNTQLEDDVLINKLKELKGNYKDDKNYITFTTTKNKHWKIISFVENKYIYDKLKGLFIMAIIVALACIIIAVAISIFVARYFTKPILQICKKMKLVENGDLTVDIKINTNDEMALLGNGFNNMIKSFSNILEESSMAAKSMKDMSKEVESLFESIKTSSQGISDSIEEVADSSTKQAHETFNMKKEIDDFSVRINNVLDYANSMEILSKETNSSTQNGNENIKDLNEKTNMMVNYSQKSMNVILNLKEKSELITNITNVINEISNRTGMLALNASIEAARAGEAGRGFSVVAEEIRNLSNETNESTNKISKIINEIVEDVNIVTNTTKETNEHIKENEISLKETNDAFLKINTNINDMNQNINDMYELIKGIENGKKIITDGIAFMSNVSEENASASEEINSLSALQNESILRVYDLFKELNNKSEQLQNSIDVFKY
ncbi:methyl-accepting chemotaxis protein [Peptostreptococcaceae bacterium AGR-M142]